MSEIFPEQSITSLPDAVAFLGALPMKVGTEPQPLSAERLAEIRSLDLLALMDDRAAPVVSGHLAALLDEVDRLAAQRDRRRDRLVALQNDALNMRGALSPMGEARKVPFPLGPTLLPAVEWLIGRVAELEHTVQGMTEGLNGHDCPPPNEAPLEAVTRFAVRLMEADRLAVELEALELGDLDGRVSATCSEPSHPTWLRSASDTRGCPWCRVAELETGIAWRDAERDRWSGVHYLIEKAIDKGWSTLDTLDVEAELGPEVAPVLAESVAEPSCPCPPADQPGPHQVGCPQVALPLPGLREVPPAPERPVNELTAAFTPMPVLREVLDGEHWAAVHHDYKGPGRDFPKLGGAL